MISLLSVKFRRSDAKRTTILEHWQAEQVKFKLKEFIGLTTSSQQPLIAVFNFQDYSSPKSLQG